MLTFRRLSIGVLLTLAAAGSGCVEEPPAGAVHVLAVDSAIDRVAARYVARGIEQAEGQQAAAVVLRVDTPGGSMDAMRDAVGAIEQARVPVISWVGPAGAQAASAGTFLVMAAHVAAMAPSTTIGAATPITATGEDVEGDLGRKVENDAAAFARGVATFRDRNADWAEQAVRDAVSASGEEAVALGVVDFLADDMSALLAGADGREAELPGGAAVTIAVRDAPVVETHVNLYERALRFVSNPLVIGLLLLVGVGLIGVELNAPGLFVPGALGLLAVVAAMLGLGMLLPEEAAVAAIVIGAVLIGLELVLPGGIVGSIGAFAMLLGLAVFAVSSTAIDLRLLLAFGAIALTAAGLVGGVALALLARRYIADTERTGSARL
jgi:membrane-bound serine protease (ClpP class)